ncbi:TIGR03086 family metal-binding protein [Antrihabitans cavernicola]|uniref:TIGR03086 family protein n=1 Tax=Antrihabitans cavernicola TaxID=2495913 RepID=A0A5A7SEI6_9NOCA|nr:TIGR03086 family metal-binding protein [Spelaeibacter cavernicola]KAA0023562.1 TIGR03086 family protein [Spelaeibacter cavernicola]
MTFQAQIADSATEAARIAAGITDAQLAGTSTPCPEFDTRTLVNHWVAYAGTGMELRALRQPYPDDLADRDFTADPQWATAFAAQLDKAVAAWNEPAAWDGEIDMGGQAMAAGDIAKMLFMELLLHGWDVAEATGQTFRADSASGALLLDIVTEQAEVYRQYDGFGEPTAVPADASDFERAVALSGRDLN